MIKSAAMARSIIKKGDGQNAIVPDEWWKHG